MDMDMDMYLKKICCSKLYFKLKILIFKSIPYII